MKKIAIVGSPNVGKSVVFNNLTGSYATVSNYPGTTVEVLRGKVHIGSYELEVIDTPGMYSLLPITEEEKVGRKIIFEEFPCCLLHVVDAKNMLAFTLQLLEAGLPVILILNVMDEARNLGINIDVTRLEKELGIKVVPAVATTGEGMDILRGRIEEHVKRFC
jgi:ferrous iron transport protein B